MTQLPSSTESADPRAGTSWMPPLGTFAVVQAVLGALERKRRIPNLNNGPPPDALLTTAEAARKLRCSIKTLLGHVASGALRYVIVGHGTKRPRRMFTPADLDSFIANHTRKDVPCPPTSQKMAGRRISTTTSKCEVIGFTARRNARRAAKPKK